MKTFLLAIMLCLGFTSIAQAQHHRGGYNDSYRYNPRGSMHGGDWLGAVIVGGLIVGAAQSREPYYEPAPVYVRPPSQPYYRAPAPSQCPEGTEPTYSRTLVRDRWNRVYETYVFTGCMEIIPN